MHVVIAAADSEPELRSEILTCFPGAVTRGETRSSLIETEFPIIPGELLPCLAFARQLLPDSKRVDAKSIRIWAHKLFEEIEVALPEHRPWSMQIEPHYGFARARHIGARSFHTLKLRHSGERLRAAKIQSPATPAGAVHRGGIGLVACNATEQMDPEAGRRRCQLIREALLELLQRKRRRLLRNLQPEPTPFTAADSLVQVLLTTPDTGVLSIALAPRPFEQRHLISPFPKGEVAVVSDKAAPSRAFAKLSEALLRLGQSFKTGETCVDLGAAPGSWTYFAVNHKAHVIAVDRSPLRQDLMRNPLVRFVRGDGFRFQPSGPVDWLLCDVIAPPENTAELLLKWLLRGWCRNFVVTLKLAETAGMSVLESLKRELPPMTAELFLARLSANKNEVCAFGVAQARR